MFAATTAAAAYLRSFATVGCDESGHGNDLGHSAAMTATANDEMTSVHGELFV